MEKRELDGDEQMPISLTRFSENGKTRGRPRALPPDVLIARRDHLLWVLEERWALVGWELQHAITIIDIRKALKPIIGFNCNELEVFRRESTKNTNRESLAKARQLVCEASKRLRDANRNLTATRERAQNARIAEQQAKGTPAEAEISRMRQERGLAAEQASEELKSANDHYYTVLADLEAQEAHYAQSELLEFVREERYFSGEPLAFANAMAGLPLVSYRRSAQECGKRRRDFVYGLTYEMFLVVSKVLGEPPESESEAAETMRDYLLANKVEKNHARAKFREHWYYLKSAIEHGYAREGPRGALPYRVFAEYQRRTQSRSQVDLIFEEENRLQ